MEQDLTTETVNPASTDLDRLDSLELVRLINREDAGIADAVAAAAKTIATVVDLIAASMREGGRLLYVGAGTSGRLGVLDASECPPTFNAEPGQVIGLIAGGDRALRHAVEGAEDSVEAGARDLEAAALASADVVVGIAASGHTPYVLGALEYARSIGATTVGLTCNAGAAIRQHADTTIEVVVGPEVLAGSTRMKAGTATKMVLNMLTTGAMVRLGKTYGNLMVDLCASNRKLQQRTLGILRSVTRLEADAASDLLAACDGELKTAIVCAQLGVAPRDGRARLANAQGRLREALETRGR